jgi:hypothetical protein
VACLNSVLGRPQVNPQWQEGQVISDFGIFGRKAAEEFLAGGSTCTSQLAPVEDQSGNHVTITASQLPTAAGFEDVYFVRVYTIAGAHCFRTARRAL